jgi:hypothetical protein
MSKPIQRTDSFRLACYAAWRAGNEWRSITFTKCNPNWHESVKAKWPKGFWRVTFGPKDDTNRFAKFTEALDAVIDNKIK